MAAHNIFDSNKFCAHWQSMIPFPSSNNKNPDATASWRPQTKLPARPRVCPNSFPKQGLIGKTRTSAITKTVSSNPRDRQPKSRPKAHHELKNKKGDYFFNSSTKALTLSTVPAGLPGWATSTLPFLSTTNTPRCVPLGCFLSPMAAMRVDWGSHSSGYGSFCFSLNVVLALGESALRP